MHQKKKSKKEREGGGRKKRERGEWKVRPFLLWICASFQSPSKLGDQRIHTDSPRSTHKTA